MANNKYWWAVMYPENMVDDWENSLGDILQLPYAYAIHNKDLDKDGDSSKLHIHLIIAFNNTTTYNHAMSVFSLLSAPGKKALNTIEFIISIRHAYNYLIHDTEDCRKKGKYQYDPSCRVLGNNFDIHHFEQTSVVEKNERLKELCNLIVYSRFLNFVDFYMYVVDHYDSGYFEILKSHSGFLERLTRGNFQRFQSGLVNSSLEDYDPKRYVTGDGV